MSKEVYNEYHRNYESSRYKKRRDAAIIQLGGKCVVCGSTENLEIDHIDRTTKSYAISKIVSHSEAKWQTELAKCQLLCVIHHREKTSRENSVDHGEGLTGKKNCRCELCKPLKNAWARKNRKSRARS